MVQTTGTPPTQTPAEQVSACVQAFPSLQEVPSGTAGLEQRPVTGSRVPARWHWSRAVQADAVQTPALQVEPLVQPTAQPPQLLGSLEVVLQTPLQSVPVVQVQVPPTQVSPPTMLQACPQLPQLLMSLAVSVQLPPQAVSPGEQAPQMPAPQPSRAP